MNTAPHDVWGMNQGEFHSFRLRMARQELDTSPLAPLILEMMDRLAVLEAENQVLTGRLAWMEGQRL